MSEYPIMKTQVAIGKVLNFTNEKRKYKVIDCDGILYGEKGYTLICECIEDAESPSMIGGEYHFDDRSFRDHNENKIVIEEAPLAITTKRQYQSAQHTLEALGMEFAQGNDVLDEEGLREQEIEKAMDESPFEFNPDTGKVQTKGAYQDSIDRSDKAYRLLLIAGQDNELGEDKEKQTAELLCNLMHLSDRYNFTLKECLKKATGLYEHYK